MEKLYNVGQTGAGLKRDKTPWFDFVIDEIIEHGLILKITNGEQKDKYSYISFDEIDEYLVFNKI